MKVMTILGTRPEIIRLSLIIKKLDQLAESHILVHTGQNFISSLSEVFFQEMNIRQPDYHLPGKNVSLGAQIGTVFVELEKIIYKENPDKILLLGDTNSALSAILGERMGIQVIHMEAGNRCFDLRVPEEKNRRVIDAVSTYNLPYTPNSRENLLREGIPSNRIFISGNPIYEVLKNYSEQISSSAILEKMVVKKKDYFLATVHRAENVDEEISLKEIFTGINLVAETYQKRVICSIHPRTRSKLDQLKNFQINPLIELYEPFGLFDFIQLQQHAFCVLTDSGTVQEESCLLHVPAVTVRNSTERPETVECGSNIITGINAESILKSVNVMVNLPADWPLPEGYDDLNVSDKVVKFLLGGKGVV